jgi:N-acetylmuramic acid 6-phosphate etherase
MARAALQPWRLRDVHGKMCRMVADRSHIHTEQHNPASAALDSISIRDAVGLINSEDLKAVQAVGRQVDAIARAVELVSQAFTRGGRLIYVGAGTSGRLGVLDAAECPPTFSSDPSMVVGVIAGGAAALQRSIEGAEDDPIAGAGAVGELNVNSTDVVMGIAAGGTTPFVHGAVREARQRNATTIFLACTAREHISVDADLFICLDTGPEVLTGSTRLKAGTATKLVLNTITTLAMVQIGKVYGNVMVDLDASKNAKLLDRAARIVMQFTSRDRDAALDLLEEAGGKVKRAIVMHYRHCNPTQADQLLDAAGGRLRLVLKPRQ